MTIAVSMGDPSGIGPEIAIKAWQHFAKKAETENPNFAIVGALAPFADMVKSLGLDNIVQKVEDLSQAKEVFQSKLPILEVCKLAQDNIIGKPNPLNGPAILKSIELASQLVITQKADAIVTLPIAKSVLYECGFEFAGHTEFIAAICKGTPYAFQRGPVMMLAIDGLRTALVTIHEPLSSIPTLLTKELVQNTIRVTNSALVNDFGIEKPKIAVLGLNPHAGESGTMGVEEVENINPAALVCRNEGIDCSDAMPADSAFNPLNREKYDCFIAMYHDQGLIPIKTLDYWGGVNITLGLPIIRTSPDHGTGFEIAGQNIANPQSFINAIEMADRLAKNRAAKNA